VVGGQHREIILTSLVTMDRITLEVRIQVICKACYETLEARHIGSAWFEQDAT
jgi:hypothetical protein